MDKKQNKLEITISNQTVLRIIIMVILAALVVHFFELITHALTLIFIAFFLALALNPGVSALSRRLKIKSRAGATGAAYLIVLIVLIGFFSLVVPPLIRQTTDFVKTIPTTIETFKDQNSTTSKLIKQYKLDKQIDKFNSDLSNKVSNLGEPVVSTAGKVFSGVVSTIVVLVLTFMMLVEGPFWLERALEFQPASKRKHRRELATRMYKTVTNYVNGQLLIAFIAGFFALIALIILSTIFNVSINAVALAGIVILFGLIPMVGNTIAAILVCLFCLFVSAPLAIAMVIFFVVYQQVENASLQPYIQSRSNQLTPLIVFIAALLGASIAGLLGALVAIPVAGCVRIIMEDRWPTHLPRRTEVEKT